MKEKKLKMIKKIKKLFYAIQIAIYEWQLKRIAKAYWKELDKQIIEENRK